MATLHITEYASVPSLRNMPVAQEPPVTTQAVTFTTATSSSAFAATTRFVRIYGSAKAHLAWGTSATATANSPPVAADSPEYFAVPVGEAYLVSAYDGSS